MELAYKYLNQIPPKGKKKFDDLFKAPEAPVESETSKTE